MLIKKANLVYLLISLIIILNSGICLAWTDSGEAEQNVSGCGNLVTANAIYYLNTSVLTSTDCFGIVNENITFNLANYTISGDGDLGDDGITIQDKNISVKNGYIYNFGYGIRFQSAGPYSSAKNISIRSTENAIETVSYGTNITLFMIDINTTGGDAILSYGGCDTFNFTGINIDNSGGRGIDFRCSNSYIENITINNSAWEGIDGQNSIYNNTFKDIFIYDGGDEGISLRGEHNTFENIFIYNLTSASYDSIYLTESSYNNFTNVNISGTLTRDDIYLTSVSIGNIFINTSYNISKEYVSLDSNFIKKWYFSPQVNYTHNGTAVLGANVTIYNSTWGIQNSTLTNGSGQFAKLTLIEYINNGTRNYYTNYTFNVTKGGWDITSQPLNLTSNNLYYQLNINDNTGPSLSIIFPETSITYTYHNQTLNFSALDAGIGIDTCWKSLNEGPNITIDCSANSTVNNTDDSTIEGSNTIFLYANDTLGNNASTYITFGVNTETPAVNLDYHTDNTYLNSGLNVYFNFTATSVAGLDSCQLWGNWTGTWHKNYSWVGPNSGAMNFTLVNLTEGVYKWNVWCNDTSNGASWGLSNYTLTIDLTSPGVTINRVITNVGSKIIYFNATINDTYLSSCKYTIYNSLGGVDGISSNLSFSCTDDNVISVVSSFDSYTLWVYAVDLAENEAHDTYIFETLSSTAPPAGGGGGGDVIIIQNVTSNKTFCGDGICQSSGNDLGIFEDYFTCSQDCPPANIDTLFFGCFDEDPLTECIWNQISFKYIGLVSIGILILVGFITVEDKKTHRQVPIYKYYVLDKFKKNRIRQK